MTVDRVLAMSGIHNFRDYGGYSVAGGLRVRRGMLWRSGQHHEATDADLALIESLGLTRIFDLRTDKERADTPCRRPAGFSGKVLFVSDAANTAAPHVAVAQHRERSDVRRTPETMKDGMVRNYAGMPFRPKLVEMYRLAFAELAQGEGASLVNCMAGKDRTGVFVALTQHALGVHYDDILIDYLLTNTVGNPAARIAAGQRAVASLASIDLAVLAVIMNVEPEYLASAWSAITQRHGSVDAYLADVLGVDERARAAMREKLLEG